MLVFVWLKFDMSVHKFNNHSNLSSCNNINLKMLTFWCETQYMYFKSNQLNHELQLFKKSKNILHKNLVWPFLFTISYICIKSSKSHRIAEIGYSLSFLTILRTSGLNSCVPSLNHLVIFPFRPSYSAIRGNIPAHFDLTRPILPSGYTLTQKFTCSAFWSSCQQSISGPGESVCHTVF